MNGTGNAARVRWQVWLLVGAAVALYGLLRLALGPLPQDPAYHELADAQTRLGGIPHTGDVMTNLGILAAGVLGLALRPRMTIGPEERNAVNVLIASTILIAFGSAYYHWAPANATLVWDRLPIAVVLMSLLALVMADRVHPLYAREGLWPFAALGIASVVLWGISEAMGRGDLLLYLVVRIGATVAIVALLVLRKPRHTGTMWLLAAVVCEAAIALPERFDHEIFHLAGGKASGHNLKHVMAGVALACVFGWLRTRRLTEREASSARVSG